MDQETWRKTEDAIDDFEEALDELLDSSAVERLRTILAELGDKFGEKFAVDFSCCLSVSEENGERSLKMYSTGLSAADDGKVFRTWDAATPHRYLVLGNLCVVPHDKCPKCWGDWLFKFQQRNCPCCGIEFGTDCKLLIDSDVCPNCEDGKVSASEPKCDKCGFEIDPACISWG